MDQHGVQQTRTSSNSIAILSACLSAFAAAAVCCWQVVDPSIRSVKYIAQLTLGAAAWPLYVVTGSLTRQSEAAIGGAITVMWLVLVWATPLRRISVLVHLLLNFLWVFVGLLLLFGGK